MRISGPFVATVIGIVAVDDALAVIAYALALGAVSVLLEVNSSPPGWLLAIEVGRISASLALGSGIAALSLGGVRLLHRRTEMPLVILAVVLGTAALAEWLDLFPVLTEMALGFVLINRERPDDQLVDRVRNLEGLVFLMFFTVAGTHLDLGILDTAAPLALLIIAGRVVGKVGGAWAGAVAAKAPRPARRYIGLTLIPKAGVTVGLALLVAESPVASEFGAVLVSGVLASTVINELASPAIVKWAFAHGVRAWPQNDGGV